jgi:type II secretory pathway component GspD/PulD (secretin)
MRLVAVLWLSSIRSEPGILPNQPSVGTASAVRSRQTIALHGYTLHRRAEATWIVPADRIPPEAFTVKVVPLAYARAGELAYSLSWVAPPSVRVVPYYLTNSLIISGYPAAVEALVDLIK